MDWVAALPMYNLTEDLAATWQALLDEFGERLRVRGGCNRLTIVSGVESDLDAFWRRPDLILSQTCGYPLTHGLAEHVHIIGAPVFDAPGCEGPHYRSAIVVRSDDRALPLESYRGRVAAYNDDASHSGMNALRHAIAPLARGGRFFSAVVKTGSHLNALHAIKEGRADIAAIDCVTLAFARDHLPEVTHDLHVLAYTRSAPGLPFIASRSLEPETLGLLAPTLADIVASRPALLARLRLRGLATISSDAYRAILDMEDGALRAGYPKLA